MERLKEVENLVHMLAQHAPSDDFEESVTFNLKLVLGKDYNEHYYWYARGMWKILRG